MANKVVACGLAMLNLGGADALSLGYSKYGSRSNYHGGSYYNRSGLKPYRANRNLPNKPYAYQQGYLNRQYEYNQVDDYNSISTPGYASSRNYGSSYSPGYTSGYDSSPYDSLYPDESDDYDLVKIVDIYIEEDEPEYGAPDPQPDSWQEGDDPWEVIVEDVWTEEDGPWPEEPVYEPPAPAPEPPTPYYTDAYAPPAYEPEPAYEAPQSYITIRGGHGTNGGYGITRVPSYENGAYGNGSYGNGPSYGGSYGNGTSYGGSYGGRGLVIPARGPIYDTLQTTQLQELRDGTSDTLIEMFTMRGGDEALIERIAQGYHE